MSSRPKESSSTSTALAVAGVSTQIAVAATDGVPIVKQVLGVLAHIIKLAEDIEKRRDALHELAKTAASMGPSIASVAAEGQLGEQVKLRIEELHDVFRAIEKLFEKHKAKKPFHKALSYAFTTSSHIDSLRQELSSAALQFQLVVALDSNTRLAHANERLREQNALLLQTHAGVQEINVRGQEEARYIGEFRRIRDSDVTDLQPIASQEVFSTSYVRKIFSAKFEGSVCILRCYERTCSAVSDEDSYWDKAARRDIIEHDEVLQKLSMVRSPHRNIARLFGWNAKEDFDRFNVMNLGSVPALKVQKRIATSDWVDNIIQQVLDAVCHLSERGAAWRPDVSNPVFLDEGGNPIIGLNNDLRHADKFTHVTQITALGAVLEHGLRESCVISNPSRPHTLMVLFGATPIPSLPGPTRYTVPQRFIPTLDKKICAYLKTALASCEDDFGMWVDTGPAILRAAASRYQAVPTSYKQYTATSGGRRDSAFVCHITEDGDKLSHLMVCGMVPPDEADGMRTKLGIPFPAHAPDADTFFCAYNRGTSMGVHLKPCRPILKRENK